MARTFALIAPVWPVLLWVLCGRETVPNAPKWKETHENMSLGSNMWIRSIHFENFWRDFVARTSALIALGWPILHRVLCSIQMVSNAPKCKEMHQNMSLGSNGVDRERSLRKIPKWLRGTNFALISPVCRILQQVSCSSETVPNTPKQKVTHQNMR